MDGIAAAANQIMPIGQWLARIAQNIGAGRWQPEIIADFAPRQPDAIGDIHPAGLVIRTLAAFQVEQLARDIGGIDAARVLILHLMQAAFAAAIAQGLPLRTVELVQRTFPEWRFAQFSAPISQALARL